jgi:flagellar hook protein FlgE
MSFQTGLSGLNASSRSLDVIGNNIANANTTGMKASRAEFSGLVSSALSSASSGGAGIGVEVANISQQFTQGNISTTNNNLDVAINGSGFFQLTQNDGSPAYTRDGSFKLNKDGYLITNTGANLMGYPTDKTGAVTSASIQKLQLPTAAPIGANATTTVTAEFNLDARAKLATGAAATATTPAIPATPRSTYGTSLNVYDSQGVASPVNLYFEKDAAANTWKIYSGLDNAAAVPPVVFPSLGTVVFDASGKITTATSTAPSTVTPAPTGAFITLGKNTITSPNPNWSGQTPPNTMPNEITVKLDTITQFGTAFAVSNLSQDGYTAGELTGLNIGESGAITANYSNGQTQIAGQIALADFRNIQGLSPLGGNAWAATNASGLPVQGSPGVGKFGILRAGALEESNVDLTAELVNMMTAQRSYQANAQTIKTQDQIMTTLVNLR